MYKYSDSFPVLAVARHAILAETKAVVLFLNAHATSAHINAGVWKLKCIYFA